MHDLDAAGGGAPVIYLRNTTTNWQPYSMPSPFWGWWRKISPNRNTSETRPS